MDGRDLGLSCVDGGLEPIFRVELNVDSLDRI